MGLLSEWTQPQIGLNPEWDIKFEVLKFSYLNFLILLFLLLSEWTQPRMGLNPEWTQPGMGLNLEWTQPRLGLNLEWTQPRMDFTPNGT